jgi:hypothetical protein
MSIPEARGDLIGQQLEAVGSRIGNWIRSILE